MPAGAGDQLPFPVLVQEQTRAFIELILPKAQRVLPLVLSSKKSVAVAGAGGSKAAPAGGLGAKEAAAKEAAAKLPRLKKGKGRGSGMAREGGAGGQEMSAISEASREGTSGVPQDSSSA